MKKLRIITLMIAVFLLAVQLSFILHALPSALAGASDFQKLYTAAGVVRSGHGRDLYELKVIQGSQPAAATPRTISHAFDSRDMKLSPLHLYLSSATRQHISCSWP